MDILIVATILYLAATLLIVVACIGRWVVTSVTRRSKKTKLGPRYSAWARDDWHKPLKWVPVGNGDDDTAMHDGLDAIYPHRRYSKVVLPYGEEP